MRHTALALVLAAGALLVAPSGARAQTPSPRIGSFELGTGTWAPNVDADFGAPPAGSPPGDGPWEQMFGSHRRWAFRAGISRTLLTGFGSLDLGVRAGFTKASAKGFINKGTTAAPDWQRSGDTTSFQLVPTSLMLTYRLDYFADRFNVPFAPYGRVALERYNWWITDGSGKTSRKGATNGWSMSGGLALLLDFFDPGLARDLDRESGVNHTYLFFEVTKSKVDDFGSSKSWDLSDQGIAYSGGLLFVF
jgi:hypothetical protein